MTARDEPCQRQRDALGLFSMINHLFRFWGFPLSVAVMVSSVFCGTGLAHDSTSLLDQLLLPIFVSPEIPDPTPRFVHPFRNNGEIIRFFSTVGNRWGSYFKEHDCFRNFLQSPEHLSKIALGARMLEVRGYRHLLTSGGGFTEISDQEFEKHAMPEVGEKLGAPVLLSENQILSSGKPKKFQYVVDVTYSSLGSTASAYGYDQGHLYCDIYILKNMR